MIELVVNELSFCSMETGTQPAAPDIRTARLWMSTFVSCIRVATTNRWTKSIRTQQSFSNTELAPGYRLPQWRNDREVNRDERMFFRSIATQSPYLDGVSEEDINLSLGMEVVFHRQKADGLLAAMLLDGVTLSWTSDDVWNCPNLVAELHKLTDDAAENVSEFGFRHVSIESHWGRHSAWLGSMRHAEVETGLDILDKRPTIFPHIEICGSAPRQLRSLSGTERYFPWVVDCLFQAEAECAVWEAGQFPHQRLPGPASGESSTVHDNPELRKLRIFKTLTGEPMMFEYHMKNLSENVRIHYRVDEARRKVMIAYVGEHLPYQV